MMPGPPPVQTTKWLLPEEFRLLEIRRASFRWKARSAFFRSRAMRSRSSTASRRAFSSFVTHLPWCFTNPRSSMISDSVRHFPS